MPDPEWVEELAVAIESVLVFFGERGSRARFHWGAAEFERHMSVARDAISVATTTSQGDVGVRVESWASQPLSVEPGLDQTAEASIELRSGALCFQGFPVEHVLKSRVNPGWYRVRIGWSGLSASGLGDSSRTSRERLLFQLWPSAKREPQLLEPWTGWPP